MNNNYKKGDRVRIVAGKYKKQGYGTYLGTYGTVMCSIAVQGDSRPQRNLWLTSIKPMPPPPKESEMNANKKPKNQSKETKEQSAAAGQWTAKEYEEWHKGDVAFVKVATSEIRAILSDLEDMQKKMKEMTDRIERHLNQEDKDDDN
jgi:hypothetical protein